MTIFGTKLKPAKMFLPSAVLDWEISGFMRKGDYKNILLSTFGMSDKETIDIRRCFNETNHIFAFGRNLPEMSMTIDFTFFFGDVCGDGGEYASLNDLRDLYNKNRIYKLARPSITIGGFSTQGYLIAMNIGATNPSTQSCSVSLTFILDEEA